MRIWIRASGVTARMRLGKMNGKIIKLEYVAPGCVDCGRTLPPGRRKRCYHCLPPKAWHALQPAKSDASEPAEYTLSDRVAQADAYGLSYGQFMAHIEHGWKLPKRKKPIRWPRDSAHRGEEK